MITSESTATPHFAIARKKSFFFKQPLLFKSKNLKALNRKVSKLILAVVLFCIFCKSSL